MWPFTGKRQREENDEVEENVEVREKEKSDEFESKRQCVNCSKLIDTTAKITEENNRMLVCILKSIRVEVDPLTFESLEDGEISEDEEHQSSGSDSESESE